MCWSHCPRTSAFSGMPSSPCRALCAPGPCKRISIWRPQVAVGPSGLGRLEIAGVGRACCDQIPIRLLAYWFGPSRPGFPLDDRTVAIRRLGRCPDVSSGRRLAGRSTQSTSVLTFATDEGRLKTRIGADWAEARGFRTKLIERRFAADFRIAHDEPLLGCVALIIRRRGQSSKGQVLRPCLRRALEAALKISV